MKKSAYNFQPQQLHARIMEHAVPRLSFRGGDLKVWQRQVRKTLSSLLGKLPAGRVPLKPRTLWKREHPFGSIEKVVFSSEPCADVPAYFCLPKNATGSLPVFICLQGHSTGMHHSIAVQYGQEDQRLEVQGDRDFGIGCMQRGIAALCIEQRAFGERHKTPENPVARCHEPAMHALMLGRTLIGERVWDLDRAIDYLETRSEIDKQRIGVMGNSGGGTVTMFGAALLPRIKFAMPSCSFSTFRASLMQVHHCVCNYIPGLYMQLDMAEILGAFAPKPLVIVSGKTDPLFPLKEARTAFKAIKNIYTAAGVPRNAIHAVGPEGHRFYAELAWEKMLPFLKK